MAGGPPVACGNCGTAVEQEYCPACGQSRREERRGFGALLREFTDAYLSFDSKIARTLATLFFRPGRITRDFLDGTRRRYITPLRLYIFSTILLFLLFRPPTTEWAIAYAQQQREAAAEAGGAEEGGPADGGAAFELAIQDGEAPPWLRGIVERQQERLEQLSPDASVLAILHQLFATLPKALFLMLPLIALYLKLLLLGTGSLYYDHFIFALHQQSFALLLVALLPRVLSPGWAALAVLLLFTLHWAFALRRAYRIGWPRTVLTLAAMTALAPATAVAVTGAIVLYVALSF